MDYQLINIFGLSIDIIGVVILFFFGLHAELRSEDGSFVKKGSSSISEKEISKNKAYNKRVKFMSKFGLILIIFGFCIQITSSILSMSSIN
ncbi:MAG: hypothetical protein KDB74_05055 [Flavobacteriales bacterium]|nr:hypothetical protein [Flavobacteriales bacterium]